MTPLAAGIAKELTLPLKRRSFQDEAGLLKNIGETHCFEVSQVIDLAMSMAGELMTNEAPLHAFGGLAFLPAPRTWIEWRSKETGRRVGYRLSCAQLSTVAIVDIADERSSFRIFRLPLDQHHDKGHAITLVDRNSEIDFSRSGAWLLYALLTIINSPRRINQRVHMPNSGLQRRLAASQKLVGKFPLQAWREITLRAGPPVDASDAEEWQEHLSNQMPLHFVRAHKRRVPDRFGLWTLIPACWRGNPALGIKQTRYKLAA